MEFAEESRVSNNTVIPNQCALLYRNDREFAKFQFAVLRRWRDSISGNIKKTAAGAYSLPQFFMVAH